MIDSNLLVEVLINLIIRNMILLMLIYFVSVIMYITLSPSLKLYLLEINNKLTVKKAINQLKKIYLCFTIPWVPFVIMGLSLFAYPLVMFWPDMSLAQLVLTGPIIFAIGMMPIEYMWVMRMWVLLINTLQKNNIRLCFEEKTSTLVFFMDYEDLSRIKINESSGIIQASLSSENKIILKKFKTVFEADRFFDKYRIHPVLF